MAREHLTVSAGDLRKSLSDVLNRAAQAGETTLITRHGASIAALVPITVYEALCRPKETPMSMQPATRLCMANIAGGAGKTFLTLSIGAALARQGYRVAVLDMDAQASATKWVGLHDDRSSPGLDPERTAGVVFRVDEPSDAILPDPIRVQDFDLWPANDGIIRDVAPNITADSFRMGNLREALRKREMDYDFILIDTQPGRSADLPAAVVAADHVLVPVCDVKGLENLQKLVTLIKGGRAYAPNLQLRMFIPNKYQAHRRMSRRELELLQGYESVAVIAPPVRLGDLARSIQEDHRSIFDIDPKAGITQDIVELAHFIVKTFRPLQQPVGAASQEVAG
ncbi:type II toxin-antitoxin system prevent-host-death family antitoxin [Deinococcus aquatilis]|uniref:type II toxin-antitoxin system prevent-host-death family antitoxin n=1 Tax=Deinococcus aquatilis TaxID=519440 RepID=UPI00146A069D|nr:type II toxin-antitoxin system prevent-host-death family antitoxin [Deinococcus aquatilis]